MSLAGRILAGTLGLAGVPLAGLLVQQGLATPAVAIALLVLYEVVILLGTIVASVAQQVVRRRVEQVMDFFDLALGRRVSRYARYYRRYVLERDRHINARDLAHTPSHIPELDAVYVDVGLVPGSPPGQSGGLLPVSLADQGQRHSIHDFLDTAEPAVCAIIGAPGSGKSTLLRHTARRAASRGKAQRRRIPVMIALRDHAESLASDPSRTLATLIRDDVGPLSVAEPAGWWEVRLRDGDCLILLDGLDEVARSDHRAAVAEWIEKQIAKHPKNDFVITSRPHGYQTAVIPQATVLQVRPFTTDQIRRFVRGWCRASERLATGATSTEIDQRANEEAEDLLDQLFTAPALMELAVNPLLLTMMVLVHRERRSLPGGRADLYSQVCDVMLWRRLESKKMRVEPSGPVRRQILAALAYDLMIAETRDAPKSQVLEVFSRVLRQTDSVLDEESLLLEIVESSGLLVEREKDLYAFAHHTIGEYLASVHIRAKNLAVTLTRSVDDPWWRETTLLYVADSDANDIVEACLEKNSGESLALAFDCVRGHAQLDRELRARLNRLWQEAFEEDASPERRRLIASAIAFGHLRRLITDEQGTLICPDPVPEDLYWLFCKDTGTPVPECLRERPPDPARAASDIWLSDVEAFLLWLNQVAVAEHAATYRPPTPRESAFVARSHAANRRPSPLGMATWTMTPESGLAPEFAVPAESDPYLIEAVDILDAVTEDLDRTCLLVDFILAGARLDARILATAFEGTKTDQYIDNPRLNTITAIGVPQALYRNLRLASLLGGDRPGVLHGAAFNLGDALSSAYVVDASTLEGPGPHLAIIRGYIDHIRRTLTYTPRFDLALDSKYDDGFLRRIDDIKSRDTMREAAIGAALTEAIWKYERDLSDLGTGNRSRTVPLHAFAVEFIEAAGFNHRYSGSADLEAMEATLRDAVAVIGAYIAKQPAAFHAASFALELLSDAEAVLTRARPIASVNLAELRIPALMLAAEAHAAGLPDTAAKFRTVVAGLTLLEKRIAGRAPLEAILLARD